MPKSLPPSITVNLDKDTINPAYLPYWDKIYRYEIYFGSRGSGKSVHVARKDVKDLSTIRGAIYCALERRRYPQVIHSGLN
jgi:phage terminase large subunit